MLELNIAINLVERDYVLCLFHWNDLVQTNFLFKKLSYKDCGKVCFQASLYQTAIEDSQIQKDY